MKIFIFGSKLTPKPVLFSQYNWAVNFNFDELNAYEQEHQEAASLQLVNDREAELKNADLIVIELVDNNEDLCLNIGHRIRFLEATRTQPIVYFGKKNISEIMKRDPFLSIILFTKGTAYLESTENSEDIKSTLTRLESEASNFSDFKAFDESFLKKIRIPEPEDLGRHSIANQWGAFRFAQVADLELASLEFSPRLFFQYLTVGLQESEISKKIKEVQEKRTKLIIEEKKNNPQKIIPKVNRALLIDDNHDKGWSLVLSRLFTKWNENTETCLDTYKSYSSECQAALRNGDYDFVLLDFYFGEDDTKGKGLDTLKAIKKINPVLPVIMFTASNKAWNMDALYEAGADGFYIKEHPDTASDVVFSVNNYHSFIKTIDDCIEKGKLLKPYWRASHRINSNHILQEKDLGNDVWSKFGGTEGRISERIKMFIGLLKKAYEQTAFDKGAFFYSEYELAFLTLWSVLNEIQEAFYIKSEGMLVDQSKGTISNYHPDGNLFITDWTLCNQLEKFIWKVGDYDSSGRLNDDGERYTTNTFSNLKFGRVSQEFGFSSQPLDKKEFYETRLFLQIAFILKKKKELRTGYIEIAKKRVQSKNPNLVETILNNLSNSEVPKIEAEFMSVLLASNYVRNKIYLTHGGNPNSPEFSSLYNSGRESSEIWEKRIKDLFSIVYFLCTAKEWNHSN